MANDKDYQTVLLEQLVDQNKTILEAVGDMQQQVALIPAMREDIAELKQDMRVVKAAVTDMGHQLGDHERRITRLEAA